MTPNRDESNVLVAVEGLKVHFKQRHGWASSQTAWVRAVDGVNLTIREGETLALVGESGCGKTTLGRTVAGLVRPTAGSVRFISGDWSSERGTLLGRAQMVFQDSQNSLDPRQQVRSTVAEPLIVRGDRNADRRVADLIELVGLRPDSLYRFPHEFSGGQRQRIGIARALAAQTKLVVCDEPTSSLDVSVQANILTLLRDVQTRFGVSLLYISHDLAAVRSIAHRVAVMYYGKLVEIGDVDRVYEQPHHPYTVALLSAVPNLSGVSRRIVLLGDPPSPTAPPRGCRFQERCWLRAHLHNPEICVTEEPSISSPGNSACHFEHEVGRTEVSGWASSVHTPTVRAQTSTPESALLEIDQLSVELPAHGELVRAVRGVSLALAKGESIGLVGESGSGKTMTALSILRLLPKTARMRANKFTFDGMDLLSVSARQMREIRGRRIGIIFQDPLSSLNPVVKLGSQITESMRLHMGLSRTVARRRAAELLEWVGMPQPYQALDSYPHQLSGGMRQRGMIAMALSVEPSLLIADEPTTSVDVTVQAQIIGLLRRIKSETNMSLLLITHDLGVAAELVDRLAVMYAGRIVEEGPVDVVVNRPRHPYTIALLASRPTLSKEPLSAIGGAPPDLRRPIRGCAFAPRCSFAVAACAEDPALSQVTYDQRVACWVKPTIASALSELAIAGASEVSARSRADA